MQLRPRFLLLLNAIEDILSRSSLLRNPFLISRLLPYNLIPTSALTQIPILTKLKATEDEVAQCCRYSYDIDCLDLGKSSAISPHFLIFPTILIVKGVGLIGKLFEFGDFVGSLAGDARFCAYPTNDGNDFAMHFELMDQCIAVWRALLAIPFRGRILDIETYSPQRSFTISQMGEMQFQPKVIEPLRERYQRTTRLKLTDSSNCA
jgi:hypothetical protein